MPIPCEFFLIYYGGWNGGCSVLSTLNFGGSNSYHTNSYVDSTRASHLFITRQTHILHEMMGVAMVMVKTNENAVSTIPMGPLGDTRTTNMMVNGKIMAEKFSVHCSKKTTDQLWYSTVFGNFGQIYRFCTKIKQMSPPVPITYQSSWMCTSTLYFLHFFTVPGSYQVVKRLELLF